MHQSFVILSRLPVLEVPVISIPGTLGWDWVLHYDWYYPGNETGVVLADIYLGNRNAFFTHETRIAAAVFFVAHLSP